MIEDLNSQNFAESVSDHEELIILQFHDEENAACQIMETVFNKLQAGLNGRIICYTIPRSTAREIWDQFSIYQAPAFIFLKENRAVEKIQGLISYNHFISRVEKFI